MGKIKKNGKTIKYWQIEDTDFCFFELYVGRKKTFWGLGGMRNLEKFLEDNRELSDDDKKSCIG